MHYFLNTYQTFLSFVLAFVSLIVFLFILLILTDTLEKILRLKKKWSWIPITISVFGSLILCFLTITNLPNYIIDGKITELYFLNNGQETRLIVWFTHTEDDNIAEVHSNRLKSFNLESGKKIDYLNLNKRYYLDDYEIYGPFDRYAWGYSKQTSANLIDLFDLEIIYNKDKIQELNPNLGSIFEPIGDNFYNQKENSITFYNAQGQFVKVLPDYPEEEKSDPVISLRNKFIPQLEDTLDIQNIFNHEKAHIFTTLSINDEILVFVTIGDYTLSALRIDPTSKKILGQIDYIK